MQMKKFSVTPVWHGYEVVASNNASLDTVWNSEKSWFAEGTRVLISDGTHMKLYEKSSDKNVASVESQSNTISRLSIPLGNLQIIATIFSQPSVGMPPELSIAIEDADGVVVQDICLVRPHANADGRLVDCLVWGDSHNEDYTNKYCLDVYDGD